MSKILVWLTLIIHMWISINGGKYIQERAVVMYQNSKYVRNATAFTGRRKRGAPYKTSMSVITLNPWGNNVTMELAYKDYTPTPIKLKCVVCYFAKFQWTKEFLKDFSNIKDISVCPFPAGYYAVKNIDLPPRNFPLPIPTYGKVAVNVTFFLTDTKEVIVKFGVFINIST